ncbi:ATP-binding protein [Cupriavidus pampae]|uniref:OmpR/PhoB-type domain-containing protein n=1 Tax=Cupriavidus pampae TaxID=659251 RepID=A0ABM8W9X6_9BURK|nr:winged helix-turn-helix domain-containing protein [Cupriavidus pampae]CAG9164023.1 hypothetical protein LMG32289_00357 [Cupriavidus pampae]
MSETYSFGPFQLYTQSRILERAGAAIAMGSRAFDMLVAMVQRPGEVLSHRELMALAWPELVVEESNVRVQMAKLRRVLGCGQNGTQYIASVSGRGYCFVAPLTNLPVMRPDDSGCDDTNPDTHRCGLWRAAPAPLSQAIGRCEHLGELSRALRCARVVTVVGAGGAGKTTLAVLLCHAMREFAGATCFVDFSAVAHGPQQGAQLGETLARAFGLEIDTHTGDALTGQVLKTIAARRMLLVLDNCEHVIDDVAHFVEQLVLCAPEVRIVATSREALRVNGERIYAIPPLGLPPLAGPLTAQQAMAFPSVQLFMDRAMEGGYDAALADRHAAVVAGICRRLDGNPLAIELVASRVALYGIDGVAELLGNQLMLSWRGRRDAPARHGTVEATLDWSCHLLPASDRRVLHRLSTFTDEFTIDAAVAAAVDEGDTRGTMAVTQSIADLIEKSLIAVRAIDGKTTLRLLDTTRTYAATRLQPGL